MPKAKVKTAYVCDECGAEYPKWQGQCLSCKAWNSLSRVSIGPISEPRVGYAGTRSEVKRLADVAAEEAPRIITGFGELDRVLGGGLVPGSVVLIGGEPGAGKSTLLLQMCCQLAAGSETLYVTGEESLQQLALRASRLSLPMDRLQVASETRAEAVAGLIETSRPKVVILGCRTAIDNFKEEGIEVAMIRPQTLFPFPEKAIHEAAGKAGCKVAVSVEMSMGQMLEDVQRSVCGQCPVEWYGKCGGEVPTPEEVMEAVRSFMG